MRLITKAIIYLLSLTIVAFAPRTIFLAASGFIHGVWATHLYYYIYKKN